MWKSRPFAFAFQPQPKPTSSPERETAVDHVYLMFLVDSRFCALGAQQAKPVTERPEVIRPDGQGSGLQLPRRPCVGLGPTHVRVSQSIEIPIRSVEKSFLWTEQATGFKMACSVLHCEISQPWFVNGSNLTVQAGATHESGNSLAHCDHRSGVVKAIAALMQHARLADWLSVNAAHHFETPMATARSISPRCLLAHPACLCDVVHA